MENEKLNIKPVKNIFVAVLPNNSVDFMDVYIVNQNNQLIHNILITSKGYGILNGEERKTSVLRHHIDEILPENFAFVESIPKDLLSLNNEFWISYYINRQIYDKKFVFLTDSINEKNYINIPILNKIGVLHK